MRDRVGRVRERPPPPLAKRERTGPRSHSPDAGISSYRRGGRVGEWGFRMGEFTTRGALRVALAGLLAGAICAPTLALAQDDDWEFAEDATRGLTVALVRYEGERSIVARCSRGDLTLVMVGIPATTEPRRSFDATRGDGRQDHQTWLAAQGTTTFTSAVNGRTARFLRGGGALQFRSKSGEIPPVRLDFDLPAENANLDRVLEACEYSLEDDRDTIPQAVDLKTLWQVRHERDSNRTSSGSAPSGGRVVGQTETSCLVKGEVYADCRVEHVNQGSRRSAEGDARDLNGTRLDPESAAANQGRVVYILSSTSEVLLGTGRH